MTNQPTCADRIESRKDSRMSDFGALRDLAAVYDVAGLSEAIEDSATRELLEEIIPTSLFEPELHALLAGETDDVPERALEEISEAARERIYEFPLAVTRKVAWRIDLSTGGPADWLEVFVGDDGEPDRIVYHFADWFDHADVTLDGHDFDVAADYARALIPDLSE